MHSPIPPDRLKSGSLMLLVLLACVPAAFLVAPSWAWENGVLETLQVLTLLAGLGFAASRTLRQRASACGMLALWVLPLWAMLAARESSWGAVFAAPLAWTAQGPVFSSASLWYKPLVLPVAGLVCGWMVLYAWLHRLDLVLRRLHAEGRLPWHLVVIAAFAEMGSSCAEGHLHCSFAPGLPQAMAFEELVELAAYLSLVVAQAELLGYAAPAAPARLPAEAAR